jgi:hypothetical protein
VAKPLQLPNQSLRVRLAGSVLVEVILAELLVGHFALQHVIGDHQNRVPDCHSRFLGTTSTLEAGVLRLEVEVPLEREAACAAPMRALLSHFEPLRVLPERRLPADSSLPGHIPAHEAR